MPGYKGHIAWGFGISAISFWLLEKTQIVSTEIESYEWIVLALVVYLYSQLPDIDADSSKINKIWNTTAGLGGLFLIITDTNFIFGVCCIASMVALERVKHRGFTHDVWFAVLLSAPLLFFSPFIAIIGFVAYMSHIIADGEFGK